MADSPAADLLRQRAIDPIVQSLVNGIRTVREAGRCIDYLIKHRNVTFILRDKLVEFYVHKVNKENSLIKIAKLCL